MKQRLNYFLLLLMILLPTLAKAQISEGGIPPSFQNTNRLRSSVLVPVQTVSVDMDIKKLIWEDSIAESNHSAIRVAEIFPVTVNIDSTGIWSELSDSQKIWQQTVSFPGAEGLIISYKEFYIPEGGKLFIYNADKTQILGAYTHNTNEKGGSFATEIINGDRFTLEYVASTVSKEPPRIKLLDVGYVYDRNSLLRASTDNNLNYNVKDNSCIPNVNCYPENNRWIKQKRGVVLLLVKKATDNAWLACSGSLINNVKNPGVPYILTAAHCLIGSNDHFSDTEGSYDASVFYFNYEDETCVTGTGQPSMSQTMVGSNLKAFIPLNNGSDATLLQLKSNIPTSYNVYFNGWDRQNSIPSSGAIIHHPNRDVKKLTKFESSGPNPSVNRATLNLPGIQGIPNGHFKVTYSEGVTQSGSSGAPMFNENGLIVGTLSAGGSKCSNPYEPDYYGRFYYHWDKYVDNHASPKQPRTLKEFLDPDGTNVNVLEGYDPNGTSGIDDIIDSSVDFVLFPNPAINEININSKAIMRTVQIFDVSGRLLYILKDYSASTLTVNISGWSNGVYNVVIQTSEGKISDKFIKR